ncbi:MAG: chorismate synthase [Sphingobacteriales bacterium]|nr:MAG: chorismate synthase [Sphingobacteriales bacterium]
MNSFGRVFRVQIFGESHGPAVGITLDGVRASIPVAAGDFEPDLARRRPGAAGTTTRVEADVPQFLSGVYNGFTTGAPLTILFSNQNTRSEDYEALRHMPRPGHADFVMQQKWAGFNDPRGGGHTSGRLTTALVAAGVVAKKMIPDLQVHARLTEAGGTTDIEAALQQAIEQQDSIGGIVQCTLSGVPIGLGSPFFDSLESTIAHLVFSIPAIKGIAFGAGFDAARMTGSIHNDAIVDADGTTRTNHAGGINGGVSNGNTIVFDVAVKPTSSTPKAQESWNHQEGKVTPLAVRGRHDLCIALRVPVVVEAVAAIALADAQAVG